MHQEYWLIQNSLVNATRRGEEMVLKFLAERLVCREPMKSFYDSLHHLGIKPIIDMKKSVKFGKRKSLREY